MINAVGRDIPEEILKITGKEVYQGTHHFDGTEFKKDGPKTKVVINSNGSKLIGSIREALEKCGIKDGMTLGFHHHFRNGDKVLNMVMLEVHKMGIKDITLCASSLGSQNDPILPLIEDGTIVNIQSSGVRGKIGEAISAGKLKGLAYMRSHGGRVRAIESGETHVDIAFIGAPTADEYGNLAANGGKANCGVLSYSAVDAQFADRVVAVTDCLVPFPNLPAQITQTYVDYVVVVDEIGDPSKIATGAAKPTTDQRKLLMAQYCTDFVVSTPYFKEGFSYQTGVGGASIASTISLAKIMRERGIHMSFGVGGIAKPMCELLEEGLINKLVDTQDFDEYAIGSIDRNPNHFYITAGEYANPFNKGAYVNKLDFVILASLEVDVNFNCNVVVGSDGVITGAQGGHPDTAAGAKCTIVIAPIMQAQLVETAILNIVNHQSLIATKASRVCYAAQGDGIMEFGLRRAQGPDAGIYGARAAMIGGCIGTSNVLCGQLFDVPVKGTHAHSWIMSFSDEYTAFKAYSKIYPNACILLVDTYDTLKSGVPNAIKVFQEMKEEGTLKKGYGIRLDSGDLAYLSKKARKMLDEAGFPDAIISASNDLDEYLIDSLKQQGATITSWGVGTHLITAKDNPSFGGVYKLAAVKGKDGEFIPKIKLSENSEKITNPGNKTIYRIYEKDTGKIKADLICLVGEKFDTNEDFILFDPNEPWKRTRLKGGTYEMKEILVQVFKDGECVYDSPSVMDIREKCSKELDTLWPEVRRLVNPHQVHVDLSQKLYDMRIDLLDKMSAV